MNSASQTEDARVGATPLPPRIATSIGNLSRFLAILCVLAMLVSVCIEVFARSFLGFATIWVTEVTTYLVVATTFLGAAFAESRGAHVRIDLLANALPPERARALTEGLRWIAVGLVLVTLWKVAGFAMENYAGGVRSWSLLNTPLWIPQVSAVVGLAGLATILAFMADNRATSAAGLLLFAVVLFGVLADGLGFVSPGLSQQASVGLIIASTLMAALLCSGRTAALTWLAIVVPAALIFWLTRDGSLGLKSTVLIGALFFILLTGLPVAFCLLAIGVVTMTLWFPPSTISYIGERAWGAVNIFELAAIPMFVLMGSVLVRSNASTEMFHATRAAIGRVRGGLAYASILASGIFAAVSGSSIATAATMGRVAAPEMIGEGYKPELTFGVLAAGGTLGILIPPSIAMIIYGPLAGVPVTDLFMAGIVPGLLMMAVFALVVFIWLAADPASAPDGTGYSMAEKLRAMKGVLPFIILMALVLGSLYAGFATPTEAGAVGVLGAIGISAARGTFSVRDLMVSLEEAALATSFLLLIAVGAAVMSFAIDFLSLPQALIHFMEALNLSNLALFLAIVAIYLVLGMFVEPISMVLITLPIVLPVVLAAGWDPLWFGIILVMLVEIGMITPPVGMILYVLAGVSQQRASLAQISIGTLPFVGAFLTMIFVFYALPGIVTFLPGLMR